MNPLTRYLRRRRLLKEAERLECKARRLRRSLLSRLSHELGLRTGLAAALGAFVIDAHNGDRKGTDLMLHQKDSAEADKLEAKAVNLRKEAEKC